MGVAVVFSGSKRQRRDASKNAALIADPIIERKKERKKERNPLQKGI
jgi:hypothetical protein